MDAGARAANRGFTIVELMVTLVVASILLAMAVPAYQNATANSYLRGATMDLTTALNGARAEAVSDHRNVVLFALGSDNAGNVTDNNNEWGQGGWRITTTDSSGASVDVQDFHTSGSTTVNSVGNEKSLTFQPDGHVVNTSSGTAANVTFLICDSRTNEIGRTVTVNPFGHVESSMHSAPDTVCNP